MVKTPKNEAPELETKTKPKQKQSKPDVQQPAEMEEVKDAPEPTDVWTHPEHGVGCLFATMCKYGAFGLTGLAVYKKPFKDHEGNKWTYEDVYCKDNGICMLKTDAENINIAENSGPMKLITNWSLLNGVLASDGIDLLVLCGFWLLYLLTGKVNNNLLKFAKFFTGSFAYLKFAIGWIMVSCINDINHVYAWGTPDKNRLYNKQIYDNALRLSPFQISLLFFAFCLDIICMTFLIVTLDEGVSEMSHRKRLMLEEKVRLREEELERRPSRRKSYAPEEISHHDEKMSENSNSLSLTKGDLVGSKSTFKSPTSKSTLKPGAPSRSERPSGRGSMSTNVTNVSKANRVKI